MLGNNKIWYTWDRSPSEPVFSDFTYLSYKGDKKFTFNDVLSYRLTPYLNEFNVELNEHLTLDDITEAYAKYDWEAMMIQATLKEKISLLENMQKMKIKELGKKIAQELKEKANG